MRQYKIFYKRRGSSTAKFVQLEPLVNDKLYNRLEVNAAIAYMLVQPQVEGLSLRLGDEMFNIISFDQEAEAPRSFKFDDFKAETLVI